MLQLAVQFDRDRFRLDVNCHIASRVTAVFGPSGAGKTTLLHLIAGLERPGRGRIVLNDRTLFDGSARVDQPPHRRRVATVFQDGRLFPHLSVRGNLRYGERLVRPADRRIPFDDVAELLAINRLLDRPIHALSGGEQQRVALGRALLASPQLLLLDEPLASLDAALKRQVLPFLRRVKEVTRIPMLYVSHDISEVLQLTDQLLVMDEGRLIGHGTFHAVINDPQVFQLAQRLGLENVLPAVVMENLSESGLSRLQLVPLPATVQRADAATLWAPLYSGTVGTTVHIAIRPEDIAIASQPVQGVSIQNQIRGTVARISKLAGRALIEVDVGRPLLTEISLRSVHDLNLIAGRPVYCLLKAHAIRYLG